MASRWVPDLRSLWRRQPWLWERWSGMGHKIGCQNERGHCFVGGEGGAGEPLTQPATKVTLSNVPPFITNELLCREFSRQGKVVSPVKKISSGCKSPLLKHVVSQRRQLYMILNNLMMIWMWAFGLRWMGLAVVKQDAKEVFRLKMWSSRSGKNLVNGVGKVFFLSSFSLVFVFIPA